MSSTERLNAVQAKLEALGYVDLKFYFKSKLGLADSPKSEVEDNLASLLDKFVAGDYVTSSFNDAFLVAEPQIS